MNWNTFKQTFGTDTSTNFDLIRWAKYLRIKPFYYAMRDEIKDLPQYGYFITNIHTSKERGVHHSAIYSHRDATGDSANDRVYFFDSYALPPTLEIIEKFNHTNNRICGDSDEEKQDIFKDQKYCGQMALYFLYQISKGVTYDEILKDLK